MTDFPIRETLKTRRELNETELDEPCLLDVRDLSIILQKSELGVSSARGIKLH